MNQANENPVYLIAEILRSGASLKPFGNEWLRLALYEDFELLELMRWLLTPANPLYYDPKNSIKKADKIKASVKQLLGQLRNTNEHQKLFIDQTTETFHLPFTVGIKDKKGSFFEQLILHLEALDAVMTLELHVYKHKDLKTYKRGPGAPKKHLERDVIRKFAEYIFVKTGQYPPLGNNDNYTKFEEEVLLLFQILNLKSDSRRLVSEVLRELKNKV